MKFLVEIPFDPSRVLLLLVARMLLVIMPFVTSSDALVPSSFLLLVVMPGATSSFLLLLAMPLLLVLLLDMQIAIHPERQGHPHQACQRRLSRESRAWDAQGSPLDSKRLIPVPQRSAAEKIPLRCTDLLKLSARPRNTAGKRQREMG